VLESFFPAQAGALTTLPEITKPLEPYKDQLLFLGALELRTQVDLNKAYNGHDANQALLTGMKSDPKMVPGPSVDQVIADAIIKKVSLPRRSLELGALVPPGDGPYSRISFRAAGSANTPETDPWKVADALFGGAAGTVTGASGPPLPTADETKRRARRKSVLDFVLKDLGRYTRTLGTADREKVQAHLEAITEIERQLQAVPRDPAPASASCGKPALPAKVSTNAWSKDDVKNYPTVVKAQMDLLVAALCADYTRVATLMLTDAFGTNLVGHWLADRAGPAILNTDYHLLTHDYPKGDPQLRLKVIFETWFMEQLAYLVGRLKAIPEGAGTMLDNTAVVLVDPMGNGSVHRTSGNPFLIAGSCGGYFKTGRYIKYGEFGSKSYDGSYRFVPHNGLLVALCNAMDAPATSFGDAGYGGELAGLRG
jgi:hypothetical protein